MKLQRLKTTLPTLNANRISTLDAKAGTTERIRGRTWMSTRERILKRDGFACQCCGLVRSDHEIDHRIPLEQGGSNGDSNLWTLCHDCHARKTADEAKARGGGGSKSGG